MNSTLYPIIVESSGISNNAPVASYNRCIIHGDALETMSKFASGSVNLIITSPPYNLRAKIRGYNSHFSIGRKHWSGRMQNHELRYGYDGYDDAMPPNEYIRWQRDCLHEMYRLLSDDGAIYYNQKWRIVNGLLQYCKDIVDGFPLRQIIIWNKRTSINFNKSYYLPTYEVIYLFCKKKFHVSSRGVLYHDIWDVTPEKNNRHPAPFPVALIDVILDSTYPRVVLDPFAGSGTTAVSCVKKGSDIKWTLIEQSDGYCNMAWNRIRLWKLGMDLIRPILKESTVD